MPVVMWSAVADPKFIKNAQREGATDYWVKAAFNYGELGALREGLLASGRH